MGQHLVLTVNLHDRFHGMSEGGSEWPPAPGRLFQSLVAGAARGNTLPEERRAALEWLESLPPPIIAAPPARLGNRVVLFVPNNDADSLSDPRDLSSIRTKKLVHPRIPDPGPLLYAWPIDADPHGHAMRIAEAANDVYQLGRGVDMAWASGKVMNDQALVERLDRFIGTVHEPGFGRDGVLACPTRGTLKSLISRHTASRLTVEGTGRSAKTYFTNAPKPFFIGVSYRPQVQRLLFDLRRIDAPARMAPGRPSAVVSLIERIRDAAAGRLKDAMPNEEAAIMRCLVGKKPEGANAEPTEQRVRIIPLLSIGFEHADRGVRRVLVEIPSGAPLPAEDVAWAFTGLDVMDPETGEICMVLTPSDDWAMLRKHYLHGAVCWRSVTPLALPMFAERRRVDPSRRHEDAKGAPERAAEEMAAKRAVANALRHAGVRARSTAVHVQREPFEKRDQRVEAFEHKPRFPKERLWHVEIEFSVPIEGPLVLGDGRFLGLGLMAPARDVVPGIHAFAISDSVAGYPEPLDMARALRRAIMSRVQAVLGAREPIGPFFSGHSEDGSPIRGARSSHLSFVFEPDMRRLFIFAPHVVERRSPTPQELDHLRTLGVAVEGFCELRVGHTGRMPLFPVNIREGDDSLLQYSNAWETVTPYVATRHVKVGAAQDALAADVYSECRRLGLPLPNVEVSSVRGVPGTGLTGNVRLQFERRVAGPLLLGRTRHFGGGLFRPAHEPQNP